MLVLETKGFVILLVLLLVAVMLFGFKVDKKKHSGSSIIINTPIQKYGKFMSSYIGFPFELQCSFNSGVTVELDNGYLMDSDGKIINRVDGKYVIQCDDVIYWNWEEQEDIPSSVKIFFQFDSTIKEYQLIRDGYEYQLEP